MFITIVTASTERTVGSPHACASPSARSRGTRPSVSRRVSCVCGTPATSTAASAKHPADTANAPTAPNVANNAPPSSGPTPRDIALVRLSSATARPISAGPAASPHIRRRVLISVAHTVPPTNAATPTCQGRNTPANASAHTPPDAAMLTSIPHNRMALRFTASETTPANAPNNNIGNARIAETTATANPDPVICQVNNAAANVSENRMALPSAPMPQSRKNARELSNARSPGLLVPSVFPDDSIPPPRHHARARMASLPRPR